MNTSSKPLSGIYLPLWLCYGIVPIVAGDDKFTNLLTDWTNRAAHKSSLAVWDNPIYHSPAKIIHSEQQSLLS
jgi:hypothetical protein